MSNFDLENLTRNLDPESCFLFGVGRQTFFRKLRELFQIARIYYPACGYNDSVLEDTFKLEEIVYLDNDANDPDKVTNVIGDYRKAPFRDNAFDAVFFQDNHATIDGAKEILRTLKPGGIVIYSLDTCGVDMSIRNLADLPGLREVKLPFFHEFFGVRQKDA